MISEEALEKIMNMTVRDFIDRIVEIEEIVKAKNEEEEEK